MWKMLKKNFTTILLVLIFLVGLSLLLYPTVSDYWNSFHQTRAIATYMEQVESMSDEEYDRALALARAYNERLAERGGGFTLTDEEREEYNSLLNVGGNGAMGYVDIPKIDCMLPIYHGTQETVLQVATGHLEWSSLPVGGESTHSVVSGHRGLPSAKLFTRLDEIVVGDLYTLQILDETLTYEVDQIRIVLPDDMQYLKLEKGKDYCTLVTCTPYGVNSHRLLIRGHRVANVADTIALRVSADAMQMDPLMVALAIGGALIVILLIVMLIQGRINLR